MFEVRIHGRGGQGVVTAAEMLSIAGFIEGLCAQAFPSFGSERMGAPVTAFCRLDDREIRSREPITSPDALIIQDPTLLHQVKVFDGFAKDGYLLINSKRSLTELGIAEYLALNQRSTVVGLREGSLLNVNEDLMSVEGVGMRLFRSGAEPKDIPGGTALRTALTGA